MRIDEMPAVMHDWPEHTKLSEPMASVDGETVKVVYGHTPEPARTPTPPVSLREDGSPGPARLIQRDNAVDNHAQRVDGLLTALKTADDFLSVPKTGARDWAADLRYGDPIIEYINGAVALIHKALDLIDMNENG